MNDTPEQDAQRIAARGREALISRLRPAFAEAVSAHADVLSLDDQQVEEMVQRAADRADGLQWRRALAAVASDELGIGLGEALSHPTVARAQEIVGAPSYGDSLARLGLAVPEGEPEGPPDAAVDSEPEGAPAAQDAAEPAPADPAGPALAAVPDPTPALAAVPEPAPEEEPASIAPGAPRDDQLEPPPTEAYAIGESPVAAPLAPPDPAEADDEEVSPPDGDDALRLSATHLNGIATLQEGEPGLELRFGAPGLDIARRPGRVLGRLRWPEINALEVSSPRGRRRRRRTGHAQLIIRTEHGDASFEVPAIAESELRSAIAPLLERYRGA